MTKNKLNNRCYGILNSICSGLVHFIQNCHPEPVEGSNFDRVHGFLRQAQDKLAHHDMYATPNPYDGKFYKLAGIDIWYPIRNLYYDRNSVNTLNVKLF
jgi:hypothetical protein